MFRQRFTVVGERHEFRSHRAQVQPDGTGAGTAIEGEGDGAAGFIVGVNFFISDEKDVRLGFSGVGVVKQVACGCGIVDFLVTDGDGMFCGDCFFVWSRGPGRRFFFSAWRLAKIRVTG